MGNCMYCKAQLKEEVVLDVCETCGYGVWGKKMFDAIVQNMEGAKGSGNLFQGSVTDPLEKDKYERVTHTHNSFKEEDNKEVKVQNNPLSSMVKEAEENEKSLKEQGALISEETPKDNSQDFSGVQESMQKMLEEKYQDKGY